MSADTTPTKIAIIGASGRMGRMLTSAVLATDGASLAGAIDAPNSPNLGTDMGVLIGQSETGILLTDDVNSITAADAIIDFTIPAATVEWAARAAEHGIAHIIGTTGLDAAQAAAVQAAAEKNAIVWAPNYSAGVTLLMHLTEKVAATLDSAFDIEVVEMHHKHKIDAPSGTALGLGEAAARGRNVSLDTHGVFTRHGQTGAREEGTIGFATLRGGDVIGDHTVMFAGPQERLELTHKAQDRGVFASGAVRAALWAVQQKAGLYDMTDVLGLKD